MSDECSAAFGVLDDHVTECHKCLSPRLPTTFPPFTFVTPCGFCLPKPTRLGRRWREITTSRSSLWTLVRMQPPNLVSIFLERPGGLPLNACTVSDLWDELAYVRMVSRSPTTLHGMSTVGSLSLKGVSFDTKPLRFISLTAFVLYRLA